MIVVVLFTSSSPLLLSKAFTQYCGGGLQKAATGNEI